MNASEGVLSFEVLSPIPQNGQVYFWLSSNLRERIEAFGEVAWTDAAQKVGGLKFLKLRPQDRERIGAWVKQVPAAESPLARPDPPGTPPLKISTGPTTDPTPPLPPLSTKHF